MALAALVAGVNYNAQAIYLRPFDNGALADWSMNGGQNRNNEFLLDGAPNNANQGGNNIAYVPPAEAVQEFKVSDQLLRRAVRPHRRRRRQHVAEVGHEQLPRRRLRVHTGASGWTPTRSCSTRAARRRPTTTSISTASASTARSDPGSTTARTRRSSCSPARSTARARRRRSSAPCRPPAMKSGDFSNLVDAAGASRSPSTTRRPAATSTACGRAIRSRATASRPNRINADRARRCCSTTRTRTAPPPASRRGSRTSATPSTSTRTSSGTGSARSTTTSARTTARSSAGARTSATRSATPRAIRSGPAQNGQLPLCPRQRAFVGDWVHIFGAGTVFNLRGSYTYFLEWSQSD